LEQQIYRNKTKNTKGTFSSLRGYVPREGREELNEGFYKMLQKILDKVNKSDNIMLKGNMNTRVGNNKVTNTVSTNGEAAVKN
jgi:hypothetical protein